MYAKPICMRILYGNVTCIYEKSHMTMVRMIFRFEITKLSYIRNAMLYSWLYVFLIKGDKKVETWYNMNYIKIFECSRENSSRWVKKNIQSVLEYYWLWNLCATWNEIWHIARYFSWSWFIFGSIIRNIIGYTH